MLPFPTSPGSCARHLLYLLFFINKNLRELQARGAEHKKKSSCPGVAPSLLLFLILLSNSEGCPMEWGEILNIKDIVNKYPN
jgi:hypothetical protein